MFALRRCIDAVASFDQALSIDASARKRGVVPGYDYAQGSLLNARIKRAIWRDFDRAKHDVLRRVRNAERADMPFSFLAISGAPADQFACERTYAADAASLMVRRTVWT